jgi:hypothetical protein
MVENGRTATDLARRSVGKSLELLKAYRLQGNVGFLTVRCGPWSPVEVSRFALDVQRNLSGTPLEEVPLEVARSAGDGCLERCDWAAPFGEPRPECADCVEVCLEAGSEGRRYRGWVV